jgi:hypothetical protein
MANMECLHILALAELRGHSGGRDDMDARPLRSMARGHLVVCEKASRTRKRADRYKKEAASQMHTHLLDSSADRNIAVLLLHVMRAGATVVAEEDAVVLDSQGFLFDYLRIEKKWSMEKRNDAETGKKVQ